MNMSFNLLDIDKDGILDEKMRKVGPMDNIDIFLPFQQISLHDTLPNHCAITMINVPPSWK